MAIGAEKRLEARSRGAQVQGEVRTLPPVQLERLPPLDPEPARAGLGALAVDRLREGEGVMKTVDRARGRWREILAQLGLADSFLRNKHGPCPLCGGRDRYRFDDRDGSGSYFCNQCGPGSGITLVMKLRGMSFAEAARLVDGIIGCDYGPAAQPQARHRVASSGCGSCSRCSTAPVGPTSSQGYLQSRGLSVFPDVLRGHGALYYAELGVPASPPWSRRWSGLTAACSRCTGPSCSATTARRSS